MKCDTYPRPFRQFGGGSCFNNSYPGTLIKAHLLHGGVQSGFALPLSLFSNSFAFRLISLGNISCKPVRIFGGFGLPSSILYALASEKALPNPNPQPWLP
jgi:hypothetical protein